MTIIACKVDEETGDIEIASDSQITRGWTQHQNDIGISKLFKIGDDIIVGGAGLAQDLQLLRVRLMTNKPSNNSEEAVLEFFSKFYDWQNDKTGSYGVEAHFIFCVQGIAYIVENYLVSKIVTYYSIGSGMEYAQGALYLGHSAEKAVETAIALNVLLRDANYKIYNER